MHCPLSGPDLTYISLLIIPCIIYHVTNKETLNLEPLNLVYEPEVSCYSWLGGVIASYDSARNTWHCPCAKPRRSCLHKNIARWHLFQLHRQLFVSSPFDRPAQGLAQELACQESTRFEYPPSGEGLKQMVYYLMKNKTLPAELPQKYITGSMTINDIPKHLVPKETVCSECTDNVVLSEPVLITSKGKLITFNWTSYRIREKIINSVICQSRLFHAKNSAHIFCIMMHLNINDQMDVYKSYHCCCRLNIISN